MSKIFNFLIILTFTLLLSACPEPGSDIRTYCRTDTVDPDLAPVTVGDILRIYTPFDTIQYAVSGVSNVAPISGTLTIDWGGKGSYTILQNPIDNTAITTLEEKAELTAMTGIPSSTSTTYRYIEQDTSGSTKGSMYLWAFSNGISPGVTYYWTNESDTILTNVQNISIYDSPVDTASLANAPIIKDITHFPMIGCSPTSNNCIEKFAKYSEKNTTTKTTVIETIRGTFFEAYEIEIDSASVARMGNSSIAPLPIPLDFRHACSNGANNDSISFSGKMWMFPEVGIVKYQINCNSSSVTANSYNLTFDFMNSNIPLPPSKSGDQNTACN